MHTIIIKFIPADKSQHAVIHKITMPDMREPGFYRQTTSFNAFRGGRRKDATAADAAVFHGGCCWAPTGLYYCHDYLEDEWLQLNASRVRSVPVALRASFDETKLQAIHHKDIFAFYDHIGFDRKRRVYVK
jgi:hypothetical protein